MNSVYISQHTVWILKHSPVSSLTHLLNIPNICEYSYVPTCRWIFTCMHTTHTHTQTHKLFNFRNMALVVLIMQPIDHHLNPLAYTSSLPSMSYFTSSPDQPSEHFCLLNSPIHIHTHIPSIINGFSWSMKSLTLVHIPIIVTTCFHYYLVSKMNIRLKS